MVDAGMGLPRRWQVKGFVSEVAFRQIGEDVQWVHFLLHNREIRPFRHYNHHVINEFTFVQVLDLELAERVALSIHEFVPADPLLLLLPLHFPRLLPSFLLICALLRRVINMLQSQHCSLIQVLDWFTSRLVLLISRLSMHCLRFRLI